MTDDLNNNFKFLFTSLLLFVFIFIASIKIMIIPHNLSPLFKEKIKGFKPSWQKLVVRQIRLGLSYFSRDVFYVFQTLFLAFLIRE